MVKTVGVILAAAGQGRRMGMGRNKAYINLQGRPIVAYSLQFFAAWPQVKQIILVTGADELEGGRELVSQIKLAPNKTTVIAGGKQRQDSVAAGLKALQPDIEWVAVHDAARPLVSPALFARLLAADAPGVVPALPVTDTVKMVNDQGMVLTTIPRDQLCLVQTPQVFMASILRECYARAQAEGFYGTDDASLLERYQYLVQMVPGEKQNLKITTPEDLKWAEYWLSSRERSD